MITEFAIKITNTSFCFHLRGFERNILYDTKNRSLILTESDTGALIKIIEKDEDLNYEDFVLVAKNMWFDLIESFS